MNSQPLLQKTITVANFEANDTQYKIKDENGLTYSIFLSTKDGKQSKAYIDWNTQNVNVGKTIGIAYVENPNAQNPTHPYRNIRAIAPANSIEYAQNDGRPAYKGPAPKQFPKNNDTDWDEIAKGKVRHAFLLEAYKQGRILNSQLIKEVEGWVDVVMTGEMAEGNRPINADDIPF